MMPTLLPKLLMLINLRGIHHHWSVDCTANSIHYELLYSFQSNHFSQWMEVCIPMAPTPGPRQAGCGVSGVEQLLQCCQLAASSFSYAYTPQQQRSHHCACTRAQTHTLCNHPYSSGIQEWPRALHPPSNYSRAAYFTQRPAFPTNSALLRRRIHLSDVREVRGIFSRWLSFSSGPAETRDESGGEGGVM